MQKIIIILALVVMPQIAGAGVVETAHDDGFFGCDEAIKKVFSSMNGLPYKGRSVSYGQVSGHNFEAYLTSYKDGISITTAGLFQKQNGFCLAHQILIMTESESCRDIMSDDYQEESRIGKASLGKRKGGDHFVTIDIPGYCVVEKMNTHVFKATR